MIPLLVLFLSLSCSDKNRLQPDPVKLTWNFNSGDEGWSGDFTDYPRGEEMLYALYFGHDTLPLPLDQNQKALILSGHNYNSNLFMFAKKRITGLEPNMAYYIDFKVEFASDMPESTDTDGNPGRLIHVAAGATIIEPLKANGENNLYSMNISKCDQGEDGEDMVVIGDFTNGTEEPVFALKTVENDQPFHCLTNENGELWILAGFDSGYNQKITAYINSITVELF